MNITEPMTMATDFVLAMLCFLFGSILLHAGRKQGSTPIRLWGLAFFATALAAATGGTSHGLALYLSERGHALLWKTTVYAIGVANLLLSAAVVLTAFRGFLRNLLLIVVVGQFVVYGYWMATHDDFSFVIYNYGAAMLGILAVAIWRHLATGPAWAGWVIAGILVSFAAAGIQMSGFTIHKHFNHNDLYHVVQMLGAYLLYRGGMLLGDSDYQRS